MWYVIIKPLRKRWRLKYTIERNVNIVDTYIIVNLRRMQEINTQSLTRASDFGGFSNLLAKVAKLHVILVQFTLTENF